MVKWNFQIWNWDFTLRISKSSFQILHLQTHFKGETSQKERKEELYQALYEYCAMDTYAEYIIYHALKDLVK